MDESYLRSVVEEWVDGYHQDKNTPEEIDRITKETKERLDLRMSQFLCDDPEPDDSQTEEKSRWRQRRKEFLEDVLFRQLLPVPDGAPTSP